MRKCPRRFCEVLRGEREGARRENKWDSPLAPLRLGSNPNLLLNAKLPRQTHFFSNRGTYTPSRSKTSWPLPLPPFYTSTPTPTTSQTHNPHLFRTDKTRMGVSLALPLLQRTSHPYRTEPPRLHLPSTPLTPHQLAPPIQKNLHKTGEKTQSHPSRQPRP